MAGGNLSPRQKMINMMYLVLTALLALNVSAEILEAFKSLRDSLHESAESFAEKNKDTRGGIKSKITEEIGQGNHKNEPLLAVSDSVEKQANGMIGLIEARIKTLEKIADLDPATGEMHNIKELEKNYRFWMGNDASNGGRGDGEAFKLKKELDNFVTWANRFVKVNKLVAKADSTGKEPEKDLFKPLCHDEKDKVWEYHTFHGKPVVADLAMMEKFKLDVQEIHSNLLNLVKAKLGSVTFKIDSLIAVDAPVSRVVAAGMKFETKLFVAMSSSEIKPQFVGPGVTTDKGGNSATMTFTAPGGFANGQTEKEASYHAVIKVPKADGDMAELKVEGKYTIRKPEVVITSASVQNLYANCGNTINVDCPALGEFYSPKFEATEAQVLPSSTDKRVITIVPTGKTCVLSVSSLTNGQNIKIDDIKYKVIKPPRPEIVLEVLGKEYNGASPIPGKADCKVKIRPDNDFRNALPKDARYVIDNVDLLAARSLGAPTKVATFSGGGKDASAGISVPLGNSLKQDPPGTKIYFKIGSVYRMNFQNKRIEEPFGDRDLYIGAIIK
ncbi:MAG: gliding motility protein GldM [Bacteroidota bacterium]|jgi:gliding motility-associated protein GldM